MKHYLRMTDKIIEIAVLLTCFNRKVKTIKALRSLYDASKKYKERSDNHVISLTVFLTDDGSTDGTAEAVKSAFEDKDINIVQADGNAFWAGGMRLAWKEAYKAHPKRDFYLLINDDAVFAETAFDELVTCDEYSQSTYNQSGVYTGFIADEEDHAHVIYGAKVYKKSILSRTYDMQPTGTPQPCMFTNANFLAVSKEAVDKIGLLDEAYYHGGADWDYGMRASLAGIPVLTTCGVCGYSTYDHDSIKQESDKVIKMSLSERRAFLLKPQREYHDAFVFLAKFDKPKYYIMKVAYILNLYTPRLYYFLSNLRP